MFWKRLLFSYLFVIMLVLAILGMVVFNQINTTLKDQVIYSNEIILENGSKLLGDFINGMKSISLEIANHEKLQGFLVRFHTGKSILSYQKFEEIVAEDQYLRSQLQRNNATIDIFPIKHGLIFRYSEMTGAYSPLERTNENEDIYLTLEKNGGFITDTLYREESNSIVLSCVIFDMESWNIPIAVLRMEIDAIAVSSLLYNIRLEKNISPYILDGDDNVFLPYLDLQNFDERLLAEFEDDTVSFDDNILIKRDVSTTDWSIVGIIPEMEIEGKMSAVSRTFMFTTIATGILLILLSIYFAVWLSKPLQRLARRLREFDAGEFRQLVVKSNYSKEIQILYEQYNQMTARIQNLINEVMVAADREKEAELMALQAQINPHFLYNTLDSINWMALKYNAEDVRYMVNSLANMMRYSLNSGRNFITVEDEIEQVRNYVGIQEIRHNNKFKTYFEVDEDILNFQIIKLLLQPLIENAIIHGLKNTGNYGEIQVKGYKEDNYLVFEVINEGESIDMEKIQSILHPENDDKPKSYGIRNVNDRLIKQYGEEFELKFFTQNGYTYARIEIPVEKVVKEGSDE